ncbi:hypothetical protein [Planococcus rifietoensis]|uniref:hypothetical protein n=1 Tax=Planococcus rifietoensis TaxID=200991 RepID=UPI00384CEA99
MRCALCKREAELEKSHVIPKFVFRSMKKESPTGNMRLTSQSNKKVQDGDRQKLLCGSCEDLFNEDETLFANRIYHKYRADSLKEFEYEEWLNRFITSVNWRNLYLDIIGFVMEKNIDPYRLDILIQAEKIMRDYLLKERDNLETIENHIFFFNPISEASDSISDMHLHTVMGGSAFGYTFISYHHDSYYVFLNLQGLIIVTIIKPAQDDSWKNTLVQNEGQLNLNKPQYITTPLFSEFEYLAQQRKQAMEQMSEKQRIQIIDSIKKNPERYKTSKAFEQLQDDLRLKRINDNKRNN